MANMRRSRTGDWSVVIGPGPTVHFCLYIFSFSSLVRVVANLRRCLHYHITLTPCPQQLGCSVYIVTIAMCEAQACDVTITS